MEKNWFDFGDLGPIFKVTGLLRLFENGFSAPYHPLVCLLKELMDYDQTCISIFLLHGKELFRFW